MGPCLNELELQKDRVREGGEREMWQCKGANVKGRDVNSQLLKMCVNILVGVIQKRGIHLTFTTFTSTTTFWSLARSGLKA